MRTEQEMMDLIISFAINDERIRVVGMEGSRTNVNVHKDEFQDDDISYIVTDMKSFMKDDQWLDYSKQVIFTFTTERRNISVCSKHHICLNMLAVFGDFWNSIPLGI